MIGPTGLILHMAAALVVGSVAGFRFGAQMAARGLKKRAFDRGEAQAWEHIIESDRDYQNRMAFLKQQHDAFSKHLDRMARNS